MSYAKVLVTLEMEYVFGPVGDDWKVKELRERASKEARNAAEALCASLNKAPTNGNRYKLKHLGDPIAVDLV